MPKSYFRTLGNDIECQLTRELIRDCGHSGDCQYDVSRHYDLLESRLNKLNSKLIQRCLVSTGGWSIDECGDARTNLERFLWLAACDASEQLARGEVQPCTVYMACY